MLPSSNPPLIGCLRMERGGVTGTALWSLLCTQLTGSIDLFKDEDDDDDAGSRKFFFILLYKGFVI